MQIAYLTCITPAFLCAHVWRFQELEPSFVSVSAYGTTRVPYSTDIHGVLLYMAPVLLEHHIFRGTPDNLIMQLD